MIQIFNTMSGKIEDFVPIEENKVRMYVCGPTVYNLSPEDCTGGEEPIRPHRRAGQRKQNRLHEGEGGREEG